MVDKNQDFMLMRLLWSSNVIGSGGDHWPIRNHLGLLTNHSSSAPARRGAEGARRDMEGAQRGMEGVWGAQRGTEGASIWHHLASIWSKSGLSSCSFLERMTLVNHMQISLGNGNSPRLWLDAYHAPLIPIAPAWVGNVTWADEDL